jgi:hypothetical protein
MAADETKGAGSGGRASPAQPGTTGVSMLMSQAEFARHCGVSRAAVSQWKHPANNILRDDAFTKPGRKGQIIVEVALDQVRRNRDIGQSLGNGIGTRTGKDTAARPDLMGGAIDGADVAAPVEGTEPESQGETKSATPPVAPMSDPRPAAPVDGKVQQAPPPAREKPGAGDPSPVEGNDGDDLGDPARPRVLTVEDELKATRLERERLALRRSQEEDALRRGLLMAADDVRDQMSAIAGQMMRVFEGALPDFASAVAEQFGVPQRDVVHLLRAQFAKVRATAAAKERVAADAQPRLTAAQVDLGE